MSEIEKLKELEETFSSDDEDDVEEEDEDYATDTDDEGDYIKKKQVKDEDKDGDGEEEEEDVNEEKDDRKNDEEDEDEDDDEDDEEDDEYVRNRLRKITKTMKKNIMQDFHPELKYRSADEIDMLSRVVRDRQGRIIDPIHQSLPILTKYEKARVLGERARQLDQGAQPFIKVSADIIDSYVIAQMELQEKAMPFILERPMPNGGCEYWRIMDLEFV